MSQSCVMRDPSLTPTATDLHMLTLLLSTVCWFKIPKPGKKKKKKFQANITNTPMDHKSTETRKWVFCNGTNKLKKKTSQKMSTTYLGKSQSQL